MTTTAEHTPLAEMHNMEFNNPEYQGITYDGVVIAQDVEYANAQLIVKAVNNHHKLVKALKNTLVLLDAAVCPQCGDKSGAYYDSMGEVCQCQWCYETEQARTLSSVEE